MARHAARARQLTTDCGDQVGHLKALLASLEASLHGTCVHDNSVSDLVAHSVRGARDMHYRFERAVALLHAGRVLTTSPQQGGLSARSCLAESAALFETLPATPPVDWPGLTHAARERSDSSVTRVRSAQARVMNIEPEPCFVALRNGLTDLVGPAAQDVFSCV